MSAHKAAVKKLNQFVAAVGLGITAIAFAASFLSFTDTSPEVKIAKHQTRQDKEIIRLKENILMLNVLFDNMKASGTSQQNKKSNLPSNILLLKNRTAAIEKELKGFRQAFNPSKPEEVITIVRLKDEIKLLHKDIKIIDDRQRMAQAQLEKRFERDNNFNKYMLSGIFLAIIPSLIAIFRPSGSN